MARLPTYLPGAQVASTALTGTYQDLGPELTEQAIGVVIYNTGDVDVQLSFDDGVTAGPIIPASGVWSDNRYNQNRVREEGLYILPVGAQVQVKQVTGAGTEGNITINLVLSNG
jgi:hypothetical protein